MEVLTPNPVPVVKKNGVFRVAGTRVTLDTVLESFLDGTTPEEIVQRYPSLELVSVYEVIGYYLRHREQLNTYLAKGRLEPKRFVPRLKHGITQLGFVNGF
jgi:uncharacterized protein (DUF433 family)